jgi:ferredoxin
MADAGKKKPVVELSECILCEVCVDICPSVFMLRDVGFIEVARLSEYPESEVDEAIKNCPKDCIYWEYF